MDDNLVAVLVSIGLCVVLPVLIVWLRSRAEINNTNRRSDIVLAAIEKNPDLDVEEFMNKLAPKRSYLKERLLQKLTWGIIFSIVGVALFFVTSAFATGMNGKRVMTMIIIGIVLVAVGLGHLIYYFTGRKTLLKEMDRELKK